MHPLIHPPSTHSSIQPSNRLFIHPPIYSSVHPALSIHRFIHPFIKPHKIICLFTETGLEKKKHTISHTHTADKKYNEELSIHTHTRTHARSHHSSHTHTRTTHILCMSHVFLSLLAYLLCKFLQIHRAINSITMSRLVTLIILLIPYDQSTVSKISECKCIAVTIATPYFVVLSTPPIRSKTRHESIVKHLL